MPTTPHWLINMAAVKFRQIVVDCFSVGYIASELHPSVALEPFRIRNIVLCLLNIAKVYLLCVFDFQVFNKYSREVQDSLLASFLKVFKKFKGSDLCNLDLENKRKEVQASLLQQNISISSSHMREFQDLWKTAALPPVIMYGNLKEMDLVKLNKLLRNLPIQILLEPEIVGCSCLYCYAHRKNALVLSNCETTPSIATNEIATHDRISQPTVCLTFSITKDSAYFYVPKDFKGRDEDTLMQHLIFDKEFKLSAYYEKAWTIKKEDVDFLYRLRSKVRERRLNNRDLHADQMYDFLLLANFETTWDGKGKRSDDDEIVEFAFILLDLRSFKLEIFHSLCQLQNGKQLTAQCVMRTGIKQTDLDKAPQFLTMFQSFLTQMSKHDILDNSRVLFAIDRRLDVKLLLKQCERFSVPLMFRPKNWLNLQDAFKAHYGLDRTLKLEHMLYVQDLTFEDIQSCCLNRAKSLASIALSLKTDGCILRINEQADVDVNGKYSFRAYDTKIHPNRRQCMELK